MNIKKHSNIQYATVVAFGQYTAIPVPLRN